MKSERNPQKPSGSPFQNLLEELQKHRVDYLLIGGQAVVAYGATQFTRDADIWINPTRKNIASLKKILDHLKAVQRFVPSLDLRLLKKGHGVHYKIPDGDRVFLIDILGKPPRISGFRSAKKAATTIDWGNARVSVLDISRLVETKKTQREKDYLIIQRLATLVFRKAAKDRTVRAKSLPWLAQNLWSVPELRKAARWMKNSDKQMEIARPAFQMALKKENRQTIEDALLKEKSELKLKDKLYWKPFLHELRSLRKSTRGS